MHSRCPMPLQFVVLGQMPGHEVVQILQRTVAVVFAKLLAVSIDVHRWEPVDVLFAAEVLVHFQRAVHLGDLDLIRADKFLRQLFPGRGQSHAVSTPRGVELHERDSLLDGVLEVRLGKLDNGRSVVLLCSFDLFGSFVQLESSGHLGHIGLQILVRPGTGILFDLLAILDPQQSWVALDFEIGTDWPVLGAVDLGNADRSVVLEALGQFFPGWGQLSAVSAPRGEELDKVLSAGDVLGEGVIGQLDQRRDGFRWFGDRFLGFVLLDTELFANEGIESVQIASAAILDRLIGRHSQLEELERRISGDVLLAAQIPIGGAVNAANLHFEGAVVVLGFG